MTDKLLLSREEVAFILGRKRSAFDQLRDLPGFPKPVRMHPRAHPQWRRSDIEAFIESLDESGSAVATQGAD